ISAMWALSLEYGMATASWYAEFALRNRVSMSAMGSVIVMGSAPFLVVVSYRTFDVVVLPAALGDAGELAVQGHVPQADTAQAELAVHRTRTAALGASGVGTHAVLGLAVGLVDQGGLGHVSSP